MRTKHSHETTVDRPPNDTLALFTPKGEEAWVPGWEPEYIAPETGWTYLDNLTQSRFADMIDGWARLIRKTG